MKKIKLAAFASALFMISLLVLSAQDTKPVEKQAPSTSVHGPDFTDKNNDGICDHKADGKRINSSGNFTDKNNDGVCDNRGASHGIKKGNNFIDKNNDGICDNKDKCCKHKHGKKGKGHHGKINK